MFQTYPFQDPPTELRATSGVSGKWRFGRPDPDHLDVLRAKCGNGPVEGLILPDAAV
jgi:hypothetical protein